MKKIVEILPLTLLLCVSFSVQSQVTIGSQSIPLKGVLLDLKENDEKTGNANSEKGLILPRVILTAIDELSPMLTGLEPDYQNLKQGYTGLVVYNVNANHPFEKGMYVWDGSKWSPLKVPLQGGSVMAENGLSLSVNGAIKLGGDLMENTILNLNNDYNLIFDSGQGKIGVGTSDPKASLQIENPNNIEPFIMKNVKLITDSKNVIDNPNPTYYNLKISENGVIRKAMFGVSNPNESFMYLLRANTQIASGASTGTGGSDLKWTRNGVQSDYITLPESGLYVFSFCLYGSLTTSSSSYADGNSFYISAFKDGTAVANLIDIEEFVALRIQNYNFTSYYVNLAVSGNAGDKIYFKLSSGGTKFTWTLMADGINAANKTNMVFWKI